MKYLAAMTVWYNPNLEVLKCLSTYASYFNAVYIVDNSLQLDNEIFSELKKMNSIIYIPNKRNLGIAEALNIGCSKALKDGYKWILTMDQDSWWDENQLLSYLSTFSNNQQEDIVSYAANYWINNKHCILGTILRAIGVIKNKNNTSEKEFVDRCITSGNIINLNIWNAIGKFNKNLFIDEVDFDFCYRLSNLGYKILQFNNISFHHTIGNPRLSFFPNTRKDSHDSFRLYYMYRNKLFIIKNYPVYATKYNYEQDLKDLYKQYCTGFYNKEKNKNKEIIKKAIIDAEKIF